MLFNYYLFKFKLIRSCQCLTLKIVERLQYSFCSPKSVRSDCVRNRFHRAGTGPASVKRAANRWTVSIVLSGCLSAGIWNIPSCSKGSVKKEITILIINMKSDSEGVFTRFPIPFTIYLFNGSFISGTLSFSSGSAPKTKNFFGGKVDFQLRTHVD